MADWKDRVVGERMRVDDEFGEQIEASSFSRQQWGLIMTAVEFRIENPGDPENARLTVDTGKLPQVMSEIDNVEKQMASMGAGGGGSTSSGEGFLGGVKRALGFGGGEDERYEEAEALVREYAELLQERLEENGRWSEACRVAADE
ncbi:hypothetical protein MBEHAL_2118 [Halarchaeum acidiphilum MH1-52-1]|uniref:Uncharacterized protein n=1 Tax=Halarchaeum acidiphilum MH1-52-1 TaxID=1261545 RepID=U3AF18_9EURY|nr:DUF5799 family protein [Halarchaeum acidiphilum]GAD53358.1 hypothetical protein MBEHAL_2118 [Halarchaeum acidiphilum MH1-52-1]